jgi:hypothetical protein
MGEIVMQNEEFKNMVNSWCAETCYNHEPFLPRLALVPPKLIADTPFSWIDTKKDLEKAMLEIYESVQTCNALAVDLEYHFVDKQSKVCIISTI